MDIKKVIEYAIYIFCISTSSTSYAAFVESAIGNAVVNDATGVYFNPAALTIVPNRQIVASAAYASVLTTFQGSTFQTATSTIQHGRTHSRVKYVLPYAYLSWPITNRITVGIGVLYPFYGFTRYPTTSIIRYLQVYNAFSALDVIPAIGIKITDYLSVGIGADLEFANLELDSMVGFATMRNQDAKSRNIAHGESWGGHAGLFLHAAKGTFIGMTYHSALSYGLHGMSHFGSVPYVHTNRYHISVVTPPSWVLSVNQYLTPDLNFIATYQRMCWNTVRNLNLQNVAIRLLGTSRILPSVVIPYFLSNVSRYTLAGNYAVTKQWTVRASASRDEDPTNPRVGLATGTNYILTAGTGYKFNKFFTFDFTYAHVFYRPITINEFKQGRNNYIIGRAGGGRDYLVGKLTVNF